MCDEWYIIRDLYLGMNHKVRNFRKALRMAKMSQHPMAKWLSSIIPKRKNTWIQLMALDERRNDPEANAFYAVLGHDSRRLFDGAEGGSILAKAFLLMRKTTHDDRLIWLDECASSDDPFAIYIAALYHSGDLMLQLLRKAAELGQIDARIKYARYAYGKFDIRRLEWLSGDAFRVAKDDIQMLIRSYPNVPNHFIYHFGAFLKKADYGDLRFTTLFNQAKANCKDAVYSWLQCARRLGVVKDVRLLIARRLWKFPWKWMGKEDYLEQKRLEQFFPTWKRCKTN